MSTGTLQLVNPVYDPTPRVRRERSGARRRRQDERQKMFEFMADIEPRPRHMRLCDMSIEGCRALWIEVLRGGMRAFVRDADNASDEDDKHWVMYDADEQMRERVGSFRWICGQLGLDADILRERLVRC